MNSVVILEVFFYLLIFLFTILFYNPFSYILWFLLLRSYRISVHRKACLCNYVFLMIFFLDSFSSVSFCLICFFVLLVFLYFNWFSNERKKVLRFDGLGHGKVLGKTGKGENFYKIV